MISYIGESNREKSNNIIRKKLKRQKNIYTALILALPLIFILFQKEWISSLEIAEVISGDKQATCMLITESSQGTAFLVSKNGLLLTARHCVDNVGSDETITLNFDKSGNPAYSNLKATIVYFPEDPTDDFAVLKLTTLVDIVPLEIAEKIESPELYNPDVILIGYPSGTQTYDKANSVRNYSITADSTIFEVNAVYKGMSGGPVIDKETKKVIGIISKKQNLIITDNAGRYQGINDQAGLSYCEKIQQVFNNPSTSHLDW